MIVTRRERESRGDDRFLGKGAGMAATEHRLRVLIVDDSVDVAEVLAATVELLGHETHYVHDAGAALQAAPNFLPHLAFLDLSLPGMSGHQLGRRLRELPGLQGIILIALSGSGSDEDRRSSREAGFHEHLVKPTSLDVLEEVLSRFAVQ